jgi:prophage regulatory protein
MEVCLMSGAELTELIHAGKVAKAVYMSDRQVAARYSVARTTIWLWVKTEPGFPSPVSLTKGCTRWRLSDLEDWESRRAVRRDGARAA